MKRLDILKALLMGTLTEEQSSENINKLRWAASYISLSSPLPLQSSRHINHFKIGSDPEFCLRTTLDDKIPAYDAGLKVGLAAGADQNERLMELRPWPSVSVVEHVAGILTALRWLYRVYDVNIHSYLWRAGGFYKGDGLGGHIHFGRKRPTRPAEIEALDGLAKALRTTGLFNNIEWNRRMKGDSFHNSPYGLPGDFRIQKHGYEYRSMPSWLQSPTVAFIILCASKLAILDPGITASWNEQSGAFLMRGRNLLRGLAKLYKGRDDDAYILYHILTREFDEPFAVNLEGDFAPAWGIPRTEDVTEKDAEVILPACIKPNTEEVAEMFNHLVFKVPLQFRRYDPEFVTKLPKENKYIWVPYIVHPGRRSGFGDLVHNLVISRLFDINFDYDNRNNFVVSGSLPTLWTPAEKAFIRKFYPTIILEECISSAKTLIVVPKVLCQAQTIPGLRAVLLKSGMFPIWTVDSVKTESIEEWQKTRVSEKSKSKWSTV